MKDTSPDGNCDSLTYQFSGTGITCTPRAVNRQTFDCTTSGVFNDREVTIIVTDDEGKSTQITFLVTSLSLN